MSNFKFQKKGAEMSILKKLSRKLKKQKSMSIRPQKE